MDTILQFFWDVGSPYTYLASTQIAALEKSHAVSVEYIPFLLGGVFKATGNEAPAANPAKGRYLFKDLQDCADYYAVPFHMPSSFPANSLKAMRVAVWAQAKGKERLYAEKMLRAYWVDGLDPSLDGTIATVLEESGLPAGDGLVAASDPHIKEQLKSRTSEAVALGAFGAPTFVLNGEIFWGHDRLPIVASRLAQR